LKEYYLNTFETTNRVLIPTPTEIVKSCGSSILLQELEALKKLIFGEKLKAKGIYAIDGGKYNEVIG